MKNKCYLDGWIENKFLFTFVCPNSNALTFVITVTEHTSKKILKYHKIQHEHIIGIHGSYCCLNIKYPYSFVCWILYTLFGRFSTAKTT